MMTDHKIPRDDRSHVAGKGGVGGRALEGVHQVPEPVRHHASDQLGEGEEEAEPPGRVEGRVDLLLDRVHARGTPVLMTREFITPDSLSCLVGESTAVENTLCIKLGGIVSLVPALYEDGFLVLLVDPHGGAGHRELDDEDAE